MPLKAYGVLKGRPIDRKLGQGSKPHYQVRIVDDNTHYRIAINVKSQLSPSELLYRIDEQFSHPLLSDLKQYDLGFTPLLSTAGEVSLDYIRGNLFKKDEMIPLPHDLPGPDNDLNERIDHHIQRAMNDGSALIYAFGERWGPEHNRRDKYFGFLPGNGIHDIHMNQGNVGRFTSDDGVWQDGGLLIHFPDQQQWVAIFLAFQSQSWHTDDESGHAIVTEDPDFQTEGHIRIIAALVNPEGNDTGHETVTLLNTTPDDIDLGGWAITDKHKKKQILKHKLLAAGQTVNISLDGSSTQLSNKGGIITLLDKNGLKVHGVSYTRKQAMNQSWTLVF